MFITRSTLLHLRIPFSFFLLPVYIFALAVSPEINLWNLIISFVILHFLVYPASNGFNSYYDKDEKSIGGLEHPPTVTRELLYFSLWLDLIGLILGLLISWEFFLMVFIFGAVSKAYSHPAIRIKKYPVLSLLVASGFQGAFAFLMVFMAVNVIGFAELIYWDILIPAFLSMGMLMGFYPMTQIYQHEEDGKRGDHTISRTLGIRGTFIFVAIVFVLMDAGFIVYLITLFGRLHMWLFQLFLLLPGIYFVYWFINAIKSPQAVNYKAAMRMNVFAALAMNGYFLILWILLR